MVVKSKGNPRLFQENLGEGEILFQFGQVYGADVVFSLGISLEVNVAFLDIWKCCPS